MAEHHVAALLDKVSRALDAAGVQYAVIGGNAVAAWVGTVDVRAVRATKDVDILLRREDLDSAAAALRPVGLVPGEVLGVPVFVDENDPSPKRGVHVIIANERVRPGDIAVAPDPSATQRIGPGVRAIELLPLIVMKLQAYRFHDRGHVADLIELKLIDESWIERVPAELQQRFRDVFEEVRRQPRIG